ncbi:hypothetical protein [Nocardia rhizosphaerihabitans]|uniref:Uncharacterized protein n=1 Tax=Nocardia rhizosphaerihabitans TaxID=1691570 RepID=A0ABQ2KG33_9NOCA|nr:hypothetical protein [Nocardia rhizosphaerihabitans]GGN80720.1 hypothetical protein GCM10011610_30360 [Nocardia rhizosphaerihabitans]
MNSVLQYAAMILGAIAVVVTLSFATSTIVHYRVAKEAAGRKAAQDTTDDIHHAPLVGFTVAQAHWQMREHVRCRRESCERKAMAFHILVEAGRIVPVADISDSAPHSPRPGE